MPLWLRTLIMSIVFVVWVIFLGPPAYEAFFHHGPYPPLPFFLIPGVTWGLLNGSASFSIGPDGFSFGPKKKPPEEKEEDGK